MTGGRSANGGGSGGGSSERPVTAAADSADTMQMEGRPVPDAALLDSLSDETLAAISRFYGRTVAFDDGRVGCPALQTAFVELMDAWIDYNTLGKAPFAGRLPAGIEARDERLYRGVQDAERQFTRTGCPRP
jgi:hypothetical protein